MQVMDLAGVRDVLDVVPYASLIVDESGDIVYANPRTRRIFGCAPEELVGRSVHELVPEGLTPWPPARQERPLHRPLDRPLGEGLKVSAVRRDGSTFLADILLSPVPTPAGPYLTVVVKDVVLGQELMCGAEHLALSQRVAETGSWEHDLITGDVQFSRQMYRLLDLAPGSGQVGIQTMFERVHPVDLPRLAGEVERASAHGGGFSARVRLLSRPLPPGRPAGDMRPLDVVRWVEVRGSIDLDHQGRAVRTFGTVQDVTSRHALEGALRESDLRFRTAFDQAPTGMALIDARPGHRAQLSMVNAALCQMSGRSAARLLGSTLLELVDPQDRRRAEEHVRAMTAGQVGTAYATDLRLDGDRSPERWASVSGSLVRDGEGTPDYVVAHFVDITARRNEEAATRRRAERDRRIAAVLQKDLAPWVPRQLGPAHIAWRYQPAGQGESVCGDWVDAFPLPNGRIGLVVGDVAGHGVEAAATMTRLRMAVHLLATSGVSPAGIMRRLNDTLNETDLAEEIQMATMVHGQLDPVTGILLYSSAGHLPMLTLAPRPSTGRVVASFVPAVGGPPIGVVPGHRYLEQAVIVEPGGLLVGYTDGLIERRGRGLDVSLLELLQSMNELPIDILTSPDVGDDGHSEAIADAVAARSAPGLPDDDTAVIVLAFQPWRSSRPGGQGSSRLRRVPPSERLDDPVPPADRGT